MKCRIRRHNHKTPGNTLKFRSSKPYAARKYTDRSFDETTTELNSQRTFWDSFLVDNETSTPCRDTQIIEDFCETERQMATARSRPEIYLDDREHGTNRSREYSDFLTTDDLRRHLKLDRFGIKDQPDADHRQIAIRNLNRDTILVLAQTAACHQRDTLRDAISKHISCATSFRIHERVDGFVTPRLELHLPYLTLRRISSESDEWKARESSGEGESWLDLPSPESNAREGNRLDRFLIKKSHTSIVLCIWDYSKWVGYAFFKGSPADSDGEGDDEADGAENSNAADEIVEDDDPIPRKEIFAPEDDNHNMYADDPIRDPRRFFLRITGVWMRLVLREYAYLVAILESYVKAWQREDRNRILNISYNGPKEDVMELFHRIVKIKQLLSYVSKSISSVVREWNEFNGPNGDIKCLGDIQASHGRLLLKDINVSFVELMRLEQKLISLVTSCEDLTSALKLRMGFEGNQINLESNKLQREAHSLNRESNELQHKAHEVNLDTQRIGRRTTEAAENTSHTTRTNILMIWITTPFVIVLQYFGADQPIFSFFERNPRNFGISFCILAFAFPLITFVFDYIFNFVTTRFRPRKTHNAMASRGAHTLD